MSDRQRAIDDWIAHTESMVGTEVDEREAWNTTANADQARHYLNGLGTVNPRYRTIGANDGDEVYPTYLVSVKYPLLHGDMGHDVPMSNVIGGIEYEWYEPITVGMDLTGKTILTDVYERERDGRRHVYLVSEVPYFAGNELIARAESTMVYIAHPDSKHVGEGDDRGIYEYSKEERDAIESLYEDELERMSEVPESPPFDELEVGDRIPPTVRGPLTIGDIAAWYAGGGGSRTAPPFCSTERRRPTHRPGPETPSRTGCKTGPTNT